MKVDDDEEITYEATTRAVRRGAHFLSALQASDGHWPAENAGTLFLFPPMVSLLILIVSIIQIALKSNLKKRLW